MITKATTVSPGAVVAEKIGNPVNIPSNASSSASAPASSNGASGVSAVNASPAAKRVYTDMSRLTSNVQANSPSPPAKRSQLLATCPINALNLFQRNWTTKGRVVAKSPMRTWNNQKGSGKLFSFDLKDDSGEVRCTAFNQEADRYFERLQVGKVYIVSKASIKTANRKFSNVNNEYEISLNSDSTIEEGNENDSNCPQVQYNFVPIRELDKHSPDTMIDVVGVVTNVGNCETIVQKKTQKELRKRDLLVVDQSCGEIRLTLWGNLALDFNSEPGCVVLAQQAKISDYQGRSLSANSIYINPEVAKAIELKNWYDSCKDSISIRSMTNASAAAGGRDGQFKFLFQLCEEVLRSEKVVYATVKVHVVRLIKVQDYPSCPGENCNKRVMDMNNGLFRCEKCNKDYNSASSRIILSGIIADATTYQYFSAFHDEALKLLEKSSPEEVLAYKDNYDQLFTEFNFKQSLVRVKASMDTWKDEKRVRLNVIGRMDFDHVAYARKLMSAIRAFH